MAKEMEKEANLPITGIFYENEENANKYRRKYTSDRSRRLNDSEKAFASVACKMAGPNVRILDVPCGNGRFYEIFSGASKLILVDRSEAMLKACKERIGDKEHVEWIQSDIRSLPLPDGAVDLSFCMRLLHHMKTDEIRLAAIRELARVSRRYVALSFYNLHSLRYYRKRILRKKISGVYISFKHLVNLAKKAGLECVYRIPKINLIEQQCMIIFQKR